eukprot:m.229073 g.229073  ORF g.229073 m.229073 type:complete len:108 (+) comp33552_c1_seq2:1287-1610(+)
MTQSLNHTLAKVHMFEFQETVLAAAAAAVAVVAVHDRDLALDPHHERGLDHDPHHERDLDHDPPRVLVHPWQRKKLLDHLLASLDPLHVNVHDLDLVRLPEIECASR